MDEAVLHIDTGSAPSHTMHHMLHFTAASCPRQCQGGHKQVVSCPRQSMSTVCAHLVKTAVSVTTACCHLLVDIGALQVQEWQPSAFTQIWDVKQFVMDTLRHTAPRHDKDGVMTPVWADRTHRGYMDRDQNDAAPKCAKEKQLPACNMTCVSNPSRKGFPANKIFISHKNLPKLCTLRYVAASVPAKRTSSASVNLQVGMIHPAKPLGSFLGAFFDLIRLHR